MTRVELDIALHQGSFALSVQCAATMSAMALFGPSGSGKTTVLEAIAGLRTPAHGRIVVGDRVLFDSRAGVNVAPRFRRVGYVPQDVLLFPHLSVRRNVLFGSRGALAADVIGWLELDTFLDRAVDQLSGGERQRVALARALHTAPDVLLLDEPLAAIDLGRRRRILDALRRIRDELHVPIIAVTHAPDEAAMLAEHVVMLDGGSVVGAGAPREVLGNWLPVTRP